jgi:UDP-N-acetylglucosamine:LPS N-acetylglucosamine transferase
MAGYTYQQHPRVDQRKTEGPVTVVGVVKKHFSGTAVKRFNSKLGLGITTSVGTMWAAYAFFILSLVSLPAIIATGNPVAIVGWIAQTFLQLVLLPIIIVGQNIQAVASDARSAATYNDATAILAEAKEIQVHLAAQDAATSALLDKVAALEAALLKSKK